MKLLTLHRVRRDDTDDVRFSGSLEITSLYNSEFPKQISWRRTHPNFETNQLVKAYERNQSRVSMPPSAFFRGSYFRSAFIQPHSKVDIFLKETILSSLEFTFC